MINACAAAMITMRLLSHGIGNVPMKHIGSLSPLRTSPGASNRRSEIGDRSYALRIAASEFRIPSSAFRVPSYNVKAPRPNLPDTRSEIPDPRSTGLVQQGNDQTLCTLQVVNQDLPTILRMLSDRSHVSLVLLSPTDQKITTNLVNLPFIEVLRDLCSLAGLNYLKVGSTYIVATDDKLKAAYPREYAAAFPPAPAPQGTPIETKVYNANYVSSTQLADSLTKIFPADKLTALAGPVQSNPSISAQDTMTSTGVQSNAIVHDSAPSVAKMLILRGDPTIVDQALELAKQMDVMRPQVAIEVTIYDISDSALNDLGVSWTFGGTSITESTPHGVNFGSFARAPLSFTGVIKALAQQNKAKVLASPNVSVLDGEKAFILIGDRIAYPVLVGYSQNNAPIFSKEEERVGIYMQVAASVSSDDNVTLSLYPQVSSITGFLNVNGASYPQVSTREAQTTLWVHTGQTIVMGGLMKTEDTATYDKIPFLGDLPFLGQLFRHRNETKTASQVIISITPKVIRTDESR